MKFISIGCNFCHDRSFKISRPNGLDYYLFLVIRSAAYCGRASESRPLSPDSVVLFDKGTPQFFGAADNNYKNDWLAFSLNGDEEQRFRSLQLPKDEFLPLPMPDFFCRIIGLMYDEFALSPTADSPILKNLFWALCEKYNVAVSPEKTKLPYYNELVNLRNAIYDGPANKLTVESLADELHLSKSYFSHIYKKYFNTTPINDAIRSRIEYSKQLLYSTDYPVSKISEMLDYPHDTQFIKQFKAVTGMTPSQYRKNSI